MPLRTVNGKVRFNVYYVGTIISSGFVGPPRSLYTIVPLSFLRNYLVVVLLRFYDERVEIRAISFMLIIMSRRGVLMEKDSLPFSRRGLKRERAIVLA